jgi:hypothetical protein
MSENMKYEQQTQPRDLQPVAFDSLSSTIFDLQVLITDSVSAELDSILRTPSDTTFRFFEIKPAEKLFIGHAEYPQDTAYYEHILWKGLEIRHRHVNQTGNDVLTIIFFLLFALIVSVRTGYTRYISFLFQSVFNYTASVRMYREKNYSFLHGAFRLEIIFYIVSSIFAYQILMNFSSSEGHFQVVEFLQSTAMILIFFLGKKLLYKILGSLFIGASDTGELMFNMDNTYRAAGIILFPIVGVIAFGPFGNTVVAIVAGIITLLFFYGLLLKRAVSILIKKQVSIFYLFLYLCTLEFLPLLLIYKVAKG